MKPLTPERVSDEVLTALFDVATTGSATLGEFNAHAIVAELRHHRLVEQKAKRVVEVAASDEMPRDVGQAIDELREALR